MRKAGEKAKREEGNLEVQIEVIRGCTKGRNECFLATIVVVSFFHFVASHGPYCQFGLISFLKFLSTKINAIPLMTVKSRIPGPSCPSSIGVN